MNPHEFQQFLLGWYDRAGRKDLPWQQERTPYRVWVSEIMLQQTQVSTVIPFFERFMEAFPSLEVLAKAEIDQVLHLWAGLGYYSRARNLHRAAQQVCNLYHNRFPDQLQILCDLPGVGRSTAGAILSLAFDRPFPILDGNVKRLWARLHGIETWSGESSTQRRLWGLSERYLPAKRAADYTQALMDFGATVCTRSRPECDSCPFQDACRAYKDGLVGKIPVPRPKRSKPVRNSYWLLLVDEQSRLYLERRPTTGVWGGLWSFPCWDSRTALEKHCLEIGIASHAMKWLRPRRHTFTHFQLEYTPVLAKMTLPPSTIKDKPSCWIASANEPEVAVPTPVRKLLREFGSHNMLT